MSKPFFYFRACPYILLLSAPAFGAAITSTWKDTNGNWSVAGDWTNGVPNNGGGNTFTAVLNNGSSVHLDISPTINNLTIDSVDGLAVNNSLSLTLNSGTGAGSVANNGNITLNSSGSLTDLQLIGGGTVTLSGTGTLTMSNSTLNLIYGGNTTALVIGASQLVQGAGQIGFGLTAITNNGTITANQSAGLILSPNATGFTNNGTIQSISPGSLTLSGGPFTNTSGTILLGAGTTGTGSAIVNGGAVTLSSNSTLNLSGGTIHGGTLMNSSTGNIVAVAGTTSTLGGIVNNITGGQIAVNEGAVLKLEGSGTYTNNGSIGLNSMGSLTDLQLIGGGTVTLGGSGTVTLGNNVNNRIYGGNTTALVIGANQSVQGAGQIGFGLTAITNNGTITANQSAGLILSPNATGFTNNGTIQSISPGSLTLSGGPFTNTSGTILLGAGTTGTGSAIVNGGAVTLSSNSTLNLSGGTIHGGTLTNSSTGIINAAAGTADTLGGVVNNVAGGQIAVNDGAVLSFEGIGTYTNNGGIALNSSGATTDLQLIGGGTVTLGGNGSVNLSNFTGNRIWSPGGTTAITFGSNQLVQGAGQIGMGVTTITNNGTITANQSAGLTLSPNATGFTNNGTIQSISPGSLTLSGGPFTNTSGTILLGAGTTGTGSAIVNGGAVTLSSNSTLNLSGGTIHGGTLTNSSTGIINAAAGTADTLGGIVNNVAGGQFAVSNAAVVSLEGTGTYNNNGSIALNSSGATTDLQLIGGGTVTLGGNGSVNLSNFTGNRIWSPGGTTAITIGPNQLVQGAGQIGMGVTTITNNGTITANQSAGLTLAPNATGFTNNGRVQSNAAADMLQLTGTFKNWNGATQTLTGGTYNALAGGIIKFDGANIKNNAANILLSGAGADIANGLTSADGIAPGTFANNAAAGVFTITNGRKYNLLSGFTNAGVTNVGPGATLTLSTSYVNSGTLNLLGDNTGTATLFAGVAGTTTVSGGGTITMSNNASNQIYGISTAALVIGASELVQGAGQIGVGQTAITNNGTITANQSAGLTLDPNATGFTNNGTLDATSGATLTLIGTYANTSGMIQASGAGSIVNLTSGTISGGTFTITSGGAIDDNGTATVSGVTVNNGTLGGSNATTIGGLSVTGTFTKQDAGTATISGQQSFSSAASLKINGGRVKFNVTSGSATVGTGVGATIAAGATLELAGSVSALASGSNRANITNSSAAPGILVSGINQVVGNIDGSGTTQVNAGSDLTANHVVQSVLVIGGTSTSHGRVTIDASDASGNPLDAASGGPLTATSNFALASSLAPSAPFGAGAFSSLLLANIDLSANGTTRSGGTLDSRDLGDSAAAVPEPASLLLALLGLASLGFLPRLKRKKSC